MFISIGKKTAYETFQHTRATRAHRSGFCQHVLFGCAAERVPPILQPLESPLALAFQNRAPQKTTSCAEAPAERRRVDLPLAPCGNTPRRAVASANTAFHKDLQETCFVLTEISETLGKPPGVYGRKSSRNPVLQFPLTVRRSANADDVKTWLE